MTPHAFMTCRGACGSVALNEVQWDEQLFNFGKAWYCPQCGGPADLDHQKTNATELQLFLESLECA